MSASEGPDEGPHDVDQPGDELIELGISSSSSSGLTMSLTCSYRSKIVGLVISRPDGVPCRLVDFANPVLVIPASVISAVAAAVRAGFRGAGVTPRRRDPFGMSSFSRSAQECAVAVVTTASGAKISRSGSCCVAAKRTRQCSNQINLKASCALCLAPAFQQVSVVPGWAGSWLRCRSRLVSTVRSRETPQF